MDINNNQQTNTFLKGMNTDTSDFLLGSDQYRYAENVRLSTNSESNGGELRLVDGTVPLKNDDLQWTRIVAMTSIRHLLVVVAVKPNPNEGEEGEVFNIFVYNTKDGGSFDTVLNNWLPYQSDNISLVTRWENDKVAKLYIADGVHAIMSINLLAGADDPQRAADSAEDLTPQQIQYLKPMQCSVYTAGVGEGGITPAKVFYTYLLYNEAGYYTMLAPLSSEISLYDTENTGYEIDDDIISNKIVSLEIPQQDMSAFSKMIAFRITYRKNQQIAEIYKIYDDDIASFSGFVDRGSGSNLNSVSVDEMISIDSNNKIVPKEIESKGAYLFAANVHYMENAVDDDFNFSCRAPRYKDEDSWTYDWDPSKWVNEDNEIAGEGEYFKWKLVTKPVQIKDTNEIINESQGEDNTSLMRGEVYRYAVILYDNLGRATSPKWIEDIMVPPQSYEGYELVTQIQNGVYTFNRVGVEFTQIKEFPIKEKKDENGQTYQVYIKAWEIVRAPRTRQNQITITQGILGLPVEPYICNGYYGYGYTRFEEDPRAVYEILKLRYNSVTPSNVLYPLGFMSLQGVHGVFGWDVNLDAVGDNNGLLWQTNNNYALFSSPEYCYAAENYKQIFDVGQIYVENQALYPITTHQNNGNIYINNQSELYFSPGGIGDLYMWNIHYDPPKSSGHFKYVDAEHGTPAFFFEISPSNTNIISDEDRAKRTIIDQCYYAKSPKYSEFADNNGPRYMDDAITLGSNKSYINWTAYGIHAEADVKQAIFNSLKDDDDHRVMTPIASGGKCVILRAQTGQQFDIHRYEDNNHNVFPISVVNIKKSTAYPYGGHTETSYRNTDFFSHGNFIEIPDGSLPSPVEIYDGDIHLGIFTYNAAHLQYHPDYWECPRLTVVYNVPIESTVNLRATCGDLYPRMKEDPQRMPTGYEYYVQDYLGGIKMGTDNYNQEADAYRYNTAYSAETNVLPRNPNSNTALSGRTYDFRIHYSEPGTLLKVDDWLNMKTTNYIDVDTRFGEITNMKLFKDRLLFWQKNAVGMLSVNEKMVVPQIKQDENGIIDSSGLVLGEGDVLQRFDYISTMYGMKENQHCDVQSDRAIYWWDEHNKEILQYSGQLTPLTKQHLLENYINERVSTYAPALAFNNDYDEVIANVRLVDQEGSKEEAVVFNERYNIFTSVYTFGPRFSTNIDGKLYIADDSKIYKMNSDKNSKASVLFEDKVYPKIQFVVNNQPTYNKTFDIQTFGGRFYEGDDLSDLNFVYKTPLKQESRLNGGETMYTGISNREYDFRLNIPRAGKEENGVFVTAQYGDRMRGKTMQCELSSNSNSTDFSLQYVTTKYRMSWS